jgi:serpin B
MRIMQRAVVEVGETGTTAAPVTFGVESRSLGGGPVQFHADRPFLFAVEERSTGLLLFLGYVAEP